MTGVQVSFIDVAALCAPHLNLWLIGLIFFLAGLVVVAPHMNERSALVGGAVFWACGFVTVVAYVLSAAFA